MRQSSERLVSEDPPVPTQLFSLAAQGIMVARRHDMLRVRPKGRKMVLPTQVTIPLDAGLPEGRRFEESWACMVRRADFRTWSMRLISRYHIVQESTGIGTEVQEFKFEWDKERTSLASRQIRVAPAPERDLGDYVDAFSVGQDMADEWYWREQMELLTKGDVDDLISDLETQDGRVQFSSMRTNRAA